MITRATPHSHHSCRSIRRKLERRTFVCRTPESPTFLASCSRTDHPWASTFSRKSLCLRYSTRRSSWVTDPSHLSLHDAYQGRPRTWPSDSVQRVEISVACVFANKENSGNRRRCCAAARGKSIFGTGRIVKPVPRIWYFTEDNSSNQKALGRSAFEGVNLPQRGETAKAEKINCTA